MSGHLVKVYHGSLNVVPNPEIRPVDRALDFGVGFYVTSYYEQAKEWAIKKGLHYGQPACVNEYVLNLSNLSVKKFKGTSGAWLDFSSTHRNPASYLNIQNTGYFAPNYANGHHEYDVVYGEMADDRVYQVIELYRVGDEKGTKLSKEEAITMLKFYKLTDQYLLHTTKAISQLQFIRIMRVF